MRMLSIRSMVIAALVVSVNLVPAQAAPICIALTAEVSQVDDLTGVAGGAIVVGDSMSGTYVYDATTPDTNDLPTVGDYEYFTSPFGIAVEVAGFTFRTDPQDVLFGMEIVNEDADAYLVFSLNNVFDLSLPDRGREVFQHISLQLDDETGRAVRDTALPTTPPDLADWTQLFGLTIDNRNGFDFFVIRGMVTSATFCGATTSQKVVMCHYPGTPHARTITVAPAAVSAHLAHGDVTGACP
jgi:hypothetical protein